MSHPNNVFHSGRFGVLLSKKYEGRICPKTVLGQDPSFLFWSKLFSTGQNESFGQIQVIMATVPQLEMPAFGHNTDNNTKNH